jgi:hypothetical protein
MSSYFETLTPGESLLYEGLMLFLGIPPRTDYIDADLVWRTEYAADIVAEYWRENPDGWIARLLDDRHLVQIDEALYDLPNLHDGRWDE